MRSLQLLSFVLLAAAATGQTAVQPPLWFEASRLAGPGGCSAPIPAAVNNRGQVALICTFGNQTRSFLWDEGALVPLGLFGMGFIRHEARGLNDLGSVAGSSWGAGFPAAAWNWQDGAFTPLGALGGSNATSVAINENGQQTGWAHTAPPIGSLIGYAYLFDGGAMTNLGELPEAILSCGSGINELGQVAGISMALGENFFRGVIADTAIGMHGVGTLGGLESHGQDLNAAGQVVGRSDTGRIVEGRWAFHAYVWQHGVMTDLRPLPGGEFSGATAINAAGDVVGFSRAHFSDGPSRAVLWRDHLPIDLNSRILPGSGWVLSTTWDINDVGQIVGTGFLDGESATFLLTPGPLDSTREGRAGVIQASLPPPREAGTHALASHAYQVTDLGALSYGKEAWAFGLNDAGQVASSAQYDEPRRFYHAVLWERGAARDLGQLSIGGFHSYATAVNAAGHVVGGSPQDLNFNRRDRAFLHDGVEMLDLGALTSGSTSFAFDIDDRGHVVGFSGTGAFFDGNEVLHAVLWSEGRITDLGTLGGLYSRAHAVNGALVIVGASLVDGGPMHAFVWSGAAMLDLGTLGGPTSEAWDISDHGLIVGFAEDADGVRRAFLVKEGPMRDLGALPGARASEAYGVNEAGQVVGTSWVPGDGPHAVLWDGGQVIDLNDVIGPDSPWKLQVARAINESSQIVGYGRLDGRTRAFLLTPAADASSSTGRNAGPGSRRRTTGRAILRPVHGTKEDLRWQRSSR